MVIPLNLIGDEVKFTFNGKPSVDCKGFVEGHAVVGQSAYIIRGNHPLLGPGPKPCLTSRVVALHKAGFETENTYYRYAFDKEQPCASE